MNEMHGPFHRTGEPGGPGAAVTALPIQGRLPDGGVLDAELLDAGKEATEVELLRTVCHALAIQ